MKHSIKDRLYYFFAEKNWGVRREYGPYVDAHQEEHKKHRVKHWWILFKLNFHYRILRKKTFMLDFSSSPKASASKSPAPKKPDQVTYLSPQNRRYDRYRFIHEIWNTTGATPELIETLKLWEQSWWCWKNDKPDIFLMYICCLLETGERDEAKRVLKKYIANKGFAEIWRYMPVAQLFVEMGYKDSTIEKSAYIFDRFEKNRAEHTFEKLLTGKSIAVVGNGPSETGKNRGEEIDSHDIVIRMNNYQIDGFENDYGSKTSVWVRNAHRSLIDKDMIEDVDYVLWESDYWHIHIQLNHLDLMYRDVLIAEDKIGYMYGLRNEICSNSSVLNPTTGMQLVYFLEKNRNMFAKIDYYGFSFMDPTSNSSYGHYYNEPTSASTDHQPHIEIAYMRELVFGKQDSRQSVSRIDGNNRCKIYACAFRDYDVKKGHTGGPGGVLAMQQELLGSAYKNCPIQYLFQPPKITYPPEVQAQINSVAGKLRGVIQGAYFIQSHPTIKRDLNNGNSVVLICHDLGTAYGAFLSGLKYSVVYHQQGSILNEMIATGVTPTAEEIKLMNKIERRTLEHAERVYFPSLGAQQVLINTSENVAASDKIPYSEFALYNTIPDAHETLNDDELLKQLGIPQIDRQSTEIFFSCGDFNNEKGMERIPPFLEEYAKSTDKKVVWIAIGSAGAHEIFKNLETESSSYSFKSYLFGKRTDHDTLLALMNYCDYYIMMHRNSIFDLATLESMRAGAALILSPTGGNLEFNVNNNVVFVDDSNYSTAIAEVHNRDYKAWSKSNVDAFNTYFSHKRFAENYRKALDTLLDSVNYQPPAIPCKESDDRITVTGIFTENYRSVVELQIRSCKDNYNFDYRYITDEEWAKARTSKEFAFYGGNIIKTQLVIDKIKQYWGKYILVSDADIVFFKPTEEKLRELMGDQDMIFLKERSDSSEPFEKTPLNINIGFVLVKCNERSLQYWEQMQERTFTKKSWDQEEANLMLIENPDMMRWSLLPECFLNGSQITSTNVREQYICTSCGAVAKRMNMEKDEYLNQMMLIATGKRSTWFDGSEV